MLINKKGFTKTNIKNKIFERSKCLRFKFFMEQRFIPVFEIIRKK